MSDSDRASRNELTPLRQSGSLAHEAPPELAKDGEWLPFPDAIDAARKIAGKNSEAAAARWLYDQAVAGNALARVHYYKHPLHSGYRSNWRLKYDKTPELWPDHDWVHAVDPQHGPEQMREAWLQDHSEWLLPASPAKAEASGAIGGRPPDWDADAVLAIVEAGRKWLSELGRRPRVKELCNYLGDVTEALGLKRPGDDKLAEWSHDVMPRPRSRKTRQT